LEKTDNMDDKQMFNETYFSNITSDTNYTKHNEYKDKFKKTEFKPFNLSRTNKQ
jgi:hypothetical protein